MQLRPLGESALGTGLMASMGHVSMLNGVLRKGSRKDKGKGGKGNRGILTRVKYAGRMRWKGSTTMIMWQRNNPFK